MIFYLGINLGVAAVFGVAYAALRASQGRRFSLSFRTQLLISRALLCVTLVATVAAVWMVRLTHVTWSLVSSTNAESTSSELASFVSFASGLLTADLQSLGSMLLGVLIGVALIKALRTSLEYRELSSVLRAAVILRKHGRTLVVVSERVSVPLSMRTLRWQWVVVPCDLLACSQDVRLAVRHEIQHHRQGDTSWAWVSQALAIMLWPNPVLHIWRRWQDNVQELACDEALVARPGFKVAEYAHCLLSVAERALALRQTMRLAPSMAARHQHTGGNTSHLHQRIEMLFAKSSPRFPRPLLAMTLVAAIGSAVCVSALAAGLTPPSSEIASDTANTTASDCEDSEDLYPQCRTPNTPSEAEVTQSMTNEPDCPDAALPQ